MFELKVTDIATEYLGIPDTEYSATVRMQSGEFQVGGGLPPFFVALTTCHRKCCPTRAISHLPASSPALGGALPLVPMPGLARMPAAEDNEGLEQHWRRC